MIKSLRWRLQAWHALILLLVVAGSGTLFYLLLRRAKLDEIDAELVAGARVLEGVLRTGPPGRARPGSAIEDFRDRRPPPPPFRRGPRPPAEDGSPPPPGPPFFSPPPGGRPGEVFRNALTLPDSLLRRYAEEGRTPYYVIRFENGNILRADPYPPEAPLDAAVGPDRDVHVRQRGRFREVALMGPGRTRVLVGRPIDKELADLHRLGLRLILSGLAVFAAGLVGGGWLSSRAVRPVRTMSDTVAGITADRLSKRIDLAEVDVELAQLGAILNDMLGRLENSFERQVRFTADASHELRTPLSVILTHIELALARPRTAEEYREALNTCGRAAARMTSLVGDLLTLARADSGKLDLKPERVDLGAIVEESAALLEASANRQGIRVEISAGSAELFGDPDRLAQVVTNLLANAILYNRPGGRVSIASNSTADEAILTVTDTGIGISESDLPFLFDRFYRVDPARSRASGGSGLGLAICRSVVLAHGGRIDVESKIDVGTTISVRLPRLAVDRDADLALRTRLTNHPRTIH